MITVFLDMNLTHRWRKKGNVLLEHGHHNALSQQHDMHYSSSQGYEVLSLHKIVNRFIVIEGSRIVSYMMTTDVKLPEEMEAGPEVLGETFWEPSNVSGIP